MCYIQYKEYLCSRDNQCIFWSITDCSEQTVRLTDTQTDRLPTEKQETKHLNYL